MHNKRDAEEDLYWLFTLGDPLGKMPLLEDIKKRKVVIVGESV